MPLVKFARTFYVLTSKITEVVSSWPNNRDDWFVTLLTLSVLAYSVNIIDEGLLPVKNKRFRIRYFGVKFKSERLSLSKNNADKVSGGN